MGEDNLKYVVLEEFLNLTEINCEFSVDGLRRIRRLLEKMTEKSQRVNQGDVGLFEIGKNGLKRKCLRFPQFEIDDLAGGEEVGQRRECVSRLEAGMRSEMFCIVHISQYFF